MQRGLREATRNLNAICCTESQLMFCEDLFYGDSVAGRHMIHEIKKEIAMSCYNGHKRKELDTKYPTQCLVLSRCSTKAFPLNKLIKAKCDYVPLPT